MNIDYENKVKQLITTRKEKHLNKLSNCFNRLSFLSEKERFEKEYIFLEKKLKEIVNTEEDKKLKIYREILVYIGESK